MKGALLAALFFFVLAAAVSRWHQFHHRGALARHTRPIASGTARDARELRVAPGKTLNNTPAAARPLRTQASHGREDSKLEEAVTASLKKRTPGGRRYEIMQLLNFSKDEIGAVRQRCEEAEHRFWIELRSGNPEAGLFQHHWGESLLKLKELEGVVRRTRSELEKAETLEASPNPAAYLQHSRLGVNVQEQELHAGSLPPDLSLMRDRIKTQSQ